MRKVFLGVLVAMAGSLASAAIIVSPEAAGVQTTTKVGTVTETFDALANGSLGPYVSLIGTYSSGGAVIASDNFGGSNATKYISVGTQSTPTTSYSLTFFGLQSYFGVYWAAGDVLNSLDFYQGATLIKTFQVSDYSGLLSAAYLGNPTNGRDTNEYFAYLNFTSNAANTNFDKVVFRNFDTSSGFESDSHSILNSTPEPSSAGLVLLGFGVLGAIARRRRK